jgi:hypothetical protein
MTRLAAMTRGEALDYAPQWGSYVRAGDPGAYLYSEFPDARHARAALDYIESDCLPIARAGDCCGTAGACEADLRELERLALYLEPIARRVWRVTFDLVTEESSREGDSADSGFLNRKGEPVAARIGEPTPFVGMTFREACELFSREREAPGRYPLDPDCSHGRVRSIRDVGARSVSIHAPGDGMTRASFTRLAELLA